MKLANSMSAALNTNNSSPALAFRRNCMSLTIAVLGFCRSQSTYPSGGKQATHKRRKQATSGYHLSSEGSRPTWRALWPGAQGSGCR